MTYTIEDIRRLVPETTYIVRFKDGSFGIEIDGTEYVSDEPPMALFLTARAQLEVARDMLNVIACWQDGEEVNGSFDEPGSAEEARKALAKMKEMEG